MSLLLPLPSKPNVNPKGLPLWPMVETQEPRSRLGVSKTQSHSSQDPIARRFDQVKTNAANPCYPPKKRHKPMLYQKKSHKPMLYQKKKATKPCTPTCFGSRQLGATLAFLGKQWPPVAWIWEKLGSSEQPGRKA